MSFFDHGFDIVFPTAQEAICDMCSEVVLCVGNEYFRSSRAEAHGWCRPEQWSDLVCEYKRTAGSKQTQRYRVALRKSLEVLEEVSHIYEEYR